MDDHTISELVTRLSRPHASGGVVIERAAVQAAGTDFPAVISWIESRAGAPDTTAAPSRGGGLYGSRLSDGDGAAPRPPLRYVLPAATLR